LEDPAKEKEEMLPDITERMQRVDEEGLADGIKEQILERPGYMFRTGLNEWKNREKGKKRGNNSFLMKLFSKSEITNCFCTFLARCKNRL
jgi:hypothetical protein